MRSRASLLNGYYRAEAPSWAAYGVVPRTGMLRVASLESRIQLAGVRVTDPAAIRRFRRPYGHRCEDRCRGHHDRNRKR